MGNLQKMSEGQEGKDFFNTEKTKRNINVWRKLHRHRSSLLVVFHRQLSSVMLTSHAAMTSRGSPFSCSSPLALAHCPCRPSMVESLWMGRSEGLSISVDDVHHDSR